MIQKPWTLPGHEGVPPASIEDSAYYAKPVDVDTGYNSRNDGVSVNVPSRQNHRCTPADTTPDSSVSSDHAVTSEKNRGAMSFKQRQRGTYFFHPALPEGLPVLGDGCTGLSSKSSPLDPPPNTYVSQVIAEARSLPCDARQLYQLT